MRQRVVKETPYLIRNQAVRLSPEAVAGTVEMRAYHIPGAFNGNVMVSAAFGTLKLTALPLNGADNTRRYHNKLILV
jgi:hypothetical protein